MYETVIGLEIHIHLNTASKMFCGCGTEFGKAPNTQACPVCLGFPGALPVINKKALRLAIKTAFAFNCKIAKFTKFDRKHYFYPDLPKNFQISQYDKPLSSGGFLEINTGGDAKKITLRRIHLEEDAGKLIHSQGGNFSLVDYNRAGIPLLEIVTQPDLRSPEEAYDFLVKLKTIIEYLEVSNCNMEEGSLRCDANISVRPAGETSLGVKTEVKNMNSFKGVRQALEYESGRQISLLKDNKKVIQETRLWDSEKQVTDTMRTKEEAHDYRYFPEPDLMPVVTEERFLEEIKKTLPEMPQQRQERFVKSYGLSEYDAATLTRERKLADFFEETLKTFNKPKTTANWVMGDLLGTASATNLSLDEISVKPADMAGLLNKIENGSVSGKMGKEILKEAIETGKSLAAILNAKGTQISDEKQIMEVISRVLSANQKVVEDFKSGKENALAFLVGQVMKETKGKANPVVVNSLLAKRLKEGK